MDAQVTMFLSVLVVAILGTRGLSASSLPVGDQYVQTTFDLGTVRGRSSDVDGTTTDTYYGLPYAKPPLASLRFKPPEAPSSWAGVRDALSPSPECVQTTDRGAIDPNSTQSEDCLYINIHAPPRSTPNKSFPVMVWVHGGAYRNGQGAAFDGRRLATKGVVVVTFNYRLDALGFLSMEDDLMPGNYGMLDQIAALKWVKNNIASFRGNPQKVTIFGESAGSSSVSLLLLSPLAKGLFQGAIMESGGSLDPWAHAHPARAISHGLSAKLIGSAVGCVSLDRQERLKCFQAVNAQQLLMASRAISNWAGDGGLLMTPRVERVYGFLPDLPLRLLAQGQFHHVNTIRGFNENEMGFFFNFTQRSKTSSAQTFEYEAVPGVVSQFTFVDKDLFTMKMAEYYLNNITASPLAYAKAEEAFSTDFNFVAPIISEIEMASRTSLGEKHFLYEFRVRPQNSQQPEWITAVHTDEIGFVFGFERASDPAHRKVIDLMMTMWTNFAKTGNPNGENGSLGPDLTWAPFREKRQNMLDIREKYIRLTQYDKPTVGEFFSELMKQIDTAIDPGNNFGPKGVSSHVSVIVLCIVLAFCNM